MSCHLFLSISGLLLVIVAFLLQLVALLTTWWAEFTARTDLGKPKETGHYGLWSLCSTKGPHWIEDCDPLDTFFQVSAYLQISGILSVLHLISLLALIPLGSLWTIQMARRESQSCLKPKTICISKVSIAFVAVIFAITVAIFASVGETRNREYAVRKGWSFWMQIGVIGVDILITLLYVIENFRYWENFIQQHVDPDGRRAETYGNPSFDPDSPESLRHAFPPNGNVAYTENSGYPYNLSGAVDGSPQREYSRSKKNKKQTTKQNETVLTYENQSYQEHSPNRGRRNYYPDF